MAPGSVAVIVGASRGIGLELARIYLGQSNLQLVALSRNADDARKAILDTSTEPLAVDIGGGKKDTKSFDESRLTTLDIDIREEDSIHEASKKIKDKFGPESLRLLFNVSGIVSERKDGRERESRRTLNNLLAHSSYGSRRIYNRLATMSF